MELDTSILEKLYDDVVKIAQQDNIVSGDEQAILDKTKENIDKFIQFYHSAMEDNVITEEESNILNEAYKRIYKDPEGEALKDNKLTTEEVNLISKIAHTLFD